MSKITVPQLDKILADINNAEGSITTTVSTLKGLERGHIITDDYPGRCLPFLLDHVLFDGCDMPIDIPTGTVTVEAALETLEIIQKCLEDIKMVLENARPNLPLT
jgi:hypothetical protein